jgi:hypothetical protein
MQRAVATHGQTWGLTVQGLLAKVARRCGPGNDGPQRATHTSTRKECSMQKTTPQPAPVPTAPRPLTPEELKQVSGGPAGFPTV